MRATAFSVRIPPAITAERVARALPRRRPAATVARQLRATDRAAVWRAPALRRGVLVMGLLLTPSGITRLLRGLEDAGFVERASSSSDLRVTYAQLTDAGREKLEAAASAHTASICALLEEHFETGDLDAIAEILGKLPGVTDGDDSCSPG